MDLRRRWNATQVQNHPFPLFLLDFEENEEIKTTLFNNFLLLAVVDFVVADVVVEVVVVELGKL